MNNNNNNKSLPPPIISNPSETTNASNELPTPPSVPLSDPAPFPSNNNNNNTTNNNHSHRPPPQPRPRPRQRPPPPAITPLPNHYRAPPPHYNKYYPYRYGTNPMYNSYPIPRQHYTPYPYSQPHVRQVAHPHIPSYQYPTFNGITPKLPTQSQPQPANTINYPHAPPRHAPPPHASPPQTPQPQPKPKQAQISTKSPPKPSPIPISINSTPKSTPTPTKKTNAPKINPTFRPFYENEKKPNDKNEMDSDHQSDDVDSDYDPATALDPNGGKKKSKKKRKKKKKCKKKRPSTTHKILHLASQRVYVSDTECTKATKALKWREFREWLKYNLEPYDHQHSIKKKQRQLFTHKMNKLLQFCTLNELHNHGDTKRFYSLWLQIPQKQKWIQLLINDGNWFTNCTSEQQMMGYTTELSQRDYYFFRVLEGHTTPNNIILLIRCDKGGNCGELVWLQKGQNVSGTDALAIENALSSALDLRWVYLHDDSKIKYGGNTSRSQCNLYLKTIRSIAKGQSWYSQAFYRPFNCTNWPSQTNINGKTQTGVEPGTVFTQNAKQYKNSVNLIRAFQIKQLRKLLIYNTDFSKQGEKNRNKSKGAAATDEDDENKADEVYPVMHPSDLKKFDEVLSSMNEYDPYFELHGKPQRLQLEEKGLLVNPRYFFHFSEDDIDAVSVVDTDNGNDSDGDGDVAMMASTKLVTPLRRQTRSRSKRDATDEKKEKLRVNNKMCVVSRWHRRRIKVRHSVSVTSGEYIGEEAVEYRRQCRSVGQLAAVLYHEGNPESWGQNKSYGLKLVRGAKENLIKFFQHILTSAEAKEIKHLTPQFKLFHAALKSIEDTKIFGKRSKRWALKMNKMQQMQQQHVAVPLVQPHAAGHGGGYAVNNRDNPTLISLSQSPNKAADQRHKSTEPLMNIAMERQQQINYYNNRRYYAPVPVPHWSYRGYPSAINRMNRPHPHHPPPRFRAFNHELRSELAEDAQKLKVRQMKEKRRLDAHKTFLKNDLDSHLAPVLGKNGNANSNSNNKHKLLFESLKGPSNTAAKKTVQPPLRVHRNLVDCISNSQHHAKMNNMNNNDTDSTLSIATINNDSDSTINNVNINICETVKVKSVNANEINSNICTEQLANYGKAANANNKTKNMDVIVLDCDDTNIAKKTHMTRAQTRKKHQKHMSGNKRHSSINYKQPPNKRLKLQLDAIPIPNNMNRDELIEEIKKYDASFCFGKKWCRYCGCKASNCWSVRNRLTLCQTHDTEYENNELFRRTIDGYKKIPRKAIDANKNTEHTYLKNKLKLELSKQKNI